MLCLPDGDLSGLLPSPSSLSADASLVRMFLVSLSILFHLNTLREKFCQRDLIDPTFTLHTIVIYLLKYNI